MSFRRNLNSYQSEEHKCKIITEEARSLINDWINGNEIKEIIDDVHLKGDMKILNDCRHRAETSSYESVSDVVDKLMVTPLPNLTDDFVYKIARQNNISKSYGTPERIQKRHEEIKKARKIRELLVQEKKEALIKAKQEQERKNVIRDLNRKKDDDKIQSEIKQLKKDLSEKRKQTLKVEEKNVIEVDTIQRYIKPQKSKSTTKEEKTSCTNSLEFYNSIVKKRKEYEMKRKFFDEWYQFMVGRKILSSKAHAFFDWKILHFCFSNWRRQTISKVNEREHESYLFNINKQKKNENQADRQHRLITLKKCFNSWKRFVKINHFYSQSEQKTKETREKMQVFLKNVSNSRKHDKTDHTNCDLTNSRLSWIETPIVKSTPAKKSFTVSEYNKQKAVLLKQNSMIAKQKKIINELKSVETIKKNSNESEFIKPLKNVKPINKKHERPKWVKAMEDRALIRLKKQEEIKLKRLDRERENKIRKEEEKRLETEKQERLKREQIEIKRNERKIKEEKIKRIKEYQIWLKHSQKKADEHYNNRSVYYRGVLPLMKLVKFIYIQEQNAAKHFNGQLVKKCISAWNKYTTKQVEQRNYQANNFYNHFLVLRAVKQWKLFGMSMAILEKRAINHHNNLLKSKYLNKLSCYTIDEKLRLIDLHEFSVREDKKRLMRQALKLLIKNVNFQRKERERKNRLNDIHKKVLSILPDYQPTVSESFNL